MCLKENFRTASSVKGSFEQSVLLLLVGEFVCWPQVTAVVRREALLRETFSLTLAASAWSRGSATALGSTRGSPLNVCDLRAAAQLKICVV